MRDDWDLEFVPSLIPASRVSLGAANALPRIAWRAARDERVAISVAVVDSGGAFVAAEGIDIADTLSIEVADAKARSAPLSSGPTATLEALVKGGSPGLATVTSLVTVGGGAPLPHENGMIGAIGVAADTPDLEHPIVAPAAVALAGILGPSQSD